nr:hypothetical protein 32 [bacterium]
MTKEIAQFIRNTPRESLAKYFNSNPHPISDTVSWDSSEHDVVAPLLKAVDQMTDDELFLLDIDAERIVAMTDEVGQTALSSVVSDHDIKIYNDLHNACDRSLWVFLRDRAAFQRAEGIRFANEYRQGRDWDGFAGPTAITIKSDPVSLEAFKKQIIGYFKTGGNIKVEIFERSRESLKDEDINLVQIMVYREDLPASYLTFEKGDLATKVIRPVQEIALTYNAENGEIEIIAKGRECREDGVKIFMETLLQNPVDEAKRVPLKHYNISRLMSPYGFPTDAEDGIDRVIVTMMRLNPLDSSRKIILEIPSKDDKSIYAVASEWFDISNPLNSGFVLSQVKLSIHFKPDTQHPRGKTLPVKITGRMGVISRVKQQRSDSLVKNILTDGAWWRKYENQHSSL